MGAIVLMVVAVMATKRIVHASIANGMMGMMLPVYAVPVLGLALVASLVASRRLSSGPRRAAMAAAILLGCGAFTLVRTGGITGDASPVSRCGDIATRPGSGNRMPVPVRAG